MQPLHSLAMWPLRIPLKVAFKHASASRSVTDSIWVEATDGSGVTGYGEACPRTYVTHEDSESCLRFFSKWRDDLLRQISSTDDLERWVQAHRREIDQAPAAWCAIELAILDLAARSALTSVEALLGLPELSANFQYTAILGDQDDTSFTAQLGKYLHWGFPSFKMKLSRDPARNRAKMAILANAGVTRDQVRVDANNLWNSADDTIGDLRSIAPGFCAVEEPLQTGDFQGMRKIMDEIGVSTVLDESFLRLDELPQIQDDPRRWLVNVRVSKMGGLFRSLEIAKLATTMGVRLIVGAQVGETSLLTRAALTVAQFAAVNLYAQEGAFGTRLIESDITPSPLMFGQGGRLPLDKNPDWRLPLPIVRPSQFLMRGIVDVADRSKGSLS